MSGTYTCCPKCGGPVVLAAGFAHVCEKLTPTVPASTGTNPKDIIGETKPPLWLVPAAATIFESKVFGLGAKKYGPYNWRKNKVKATVYLAAALRHIFSALDGEDIDPESGQPHVAHARACMGIYLDAMATGNLVDDRPTPGVAAKLIAELTEKPPTRVETVVPAAVPGESFKCEEPTCSYFGRPLDAGVCRGVVSERV